MSTRNLLVFALALGLSACTVKQPPVEDDRAGVPSGTPPPAAEKRAKAPSFLPDDGHKLLMMHYMPWYETPEVRGYWGRHWTGHQREHNPEQLDANGRPDIWSHMHPLIGLYDSADPDVLECQLLQMKLAGVNGVIVDWYGIGDTDDHPPIHAATRELFRVAENVGMKFAACFEDRTIDLLIKRGKLTEEGITDHMVTTFDWMEAEWFGRPHYLNYQGGPLVLNFGPMYVREPGPWQAALDAVSPRPTLYGLHHLWRQMGADGGFTWVHFDPFEDTSNEQTVLDRINESFTYFSTNPAEVIVSAYPGYHDVYGPDTRQLAYRDGDTLRDTLQVAMEGPWELTQLVTWNDYGEGTCIEPTHEFGYTFLEIIQEARRNELGVQAFPFAAEDLRLPARLLALRKQGVAEPEALDEIAHLLITGACDEAREALMAFTR